MATMIADPIPVVEVAGRALPTPMTWALSLDMLQPTDTFECTLPMFVKPEEIPTDEVIQLRLGGRPVWTGRIETPKYTANDTWSVQAQDNVRRLITTSIPGVGWTIGRGSLSGELLRMADPWFSEIRFTNAADRLLRRGSTRGIARSVREPLSGAENRSISRVLDAGITRWAAIQRLLEPLGLLAWSSADGKALIVTRPNYDQALQYKFRKTPKNSNVLQMGYSRSVADRFREVVVSGSARSTGPFRAPRLPGGGGPTRKYVARRSLGIARDTSGDFRAQKRMFVVDTSIYPRAAQAAAERLLGQQQTRAEQIPITVPGLGQRTDDGRAFVLYAFDCMASVLLQAAKDSNSNEVSTIVDRSYYITRVDYRGDSSGTRTQLSMVPKGSVLV